MSVNELKKRLVVVVDGWKDTPKKHFEKQSTLTGREKEVKMEANFTALREGERNKVYLFLLRLVSV